MIDTLEIFLRIFLAGILGGFIGWEREIHSRPAGFRTHILVSVGAALVMIVSIYAFPERADPARVAAQVVSGIGFLGAGTILRYRATVRGLTTAASLWATGGIGLAIGGGLYVAGLFTTFIVFVILVALPYVEYNIIDRRAYRELKLLILDRPGMIGRVGTMLGENNISIADISMERTDQGGREAILLKMLVRIRGSFDPQEFSKKLLEIDGILKTSVNGEWDAESSF